MEKVVEIYLGDCNKRRIFHATSQQATTTIATSKEQKQTQKYYYTKSKIHKNYNSNTNRRHNENRGQQQTQQSKHRQKRTSCQQQYYAQNAATTGTSQKQQQQQQQLQPQLTPTVDYFRFSALYALVATSATAAAYHMRDAYACVTAYDEVNDDSDSDCEDDNGGNSGGTPHHHNTRQRHITDATTTMELKRSRTSLIQPQLSKLLRAACLRNGNGVRHATSIGVGTDGAGGASSCGLFNAIGTATGSGTSFVGSGFDTRSIFYLTLVFFIYCGVMMRASVAATALANATHNNNNSDSNENNAPTAATNMTPNSASIENVQTKTVRDLITSVRASPSTTSGNASALSLSSPVSNFTTDIVNNSRKVSSLAVTEASPAVLVGKDERLAKMQRVVKRDTAHVPDDEDDSAYHDDEFDEYEALINNRSAKGKYIGAPCFSNMTCETSLLHVTCEKETKTCGCEKNYPVQLGLTKGCDKPKKLGEQCFYDETCMYNDENSLCVQVRHNAICQCAHGFHSVSHTKPTRRIFCTKDLKELNSDLPTLLGVTTGIAVLAGLICMVLHLFSKTKYPRPRNFGDANLPPPIMYSSDTGIPLTVQSGRPSSRSSLRSSGSIGSYGNRRASSGGATTGGGHGVGISGGGSSGTKGILVSTSRTGSRRPSLASVHSTSSSVRSYSMMRFEKEVQQKEIRQEMKLRLARLQQQQHLNQNKPQIVIGDTLQHHMGAASAFSRLSGMPTPSPLTPNSLDELLPSVDELQEYPPKSDDLATKIQKITAESVAASTLTALRQAAVGTSEALIGATTTATASSGASGSGGLVTPATPSDMTGAAAYIGPCSSSTEAL
ncbi:uncharacterized protein LOC128860211 isoform X2 [Anastrepha ludens]|uniref:uncharacterized protein LOC128860211 isoform X2 n=1 Tax=Anastrepha ludens TaxID=28586 RepID=UPI0023B01AD3|nr:uncharacterized protein LOC128860211 isoform X2 [Anastrepha ludens]